MRLEELEPVRLGFSVLGRNDLYLVSGLEFLAQLHQFLVHLGDGLVTHLRVDGVGEIQGRGALGQTALFSARSKDIYICGNEVVMDDIQQFQGIHVRVHQDFLDAVQPGIHLVVSFAHDAVFLVRPVGGDAFFGNVVHAAGPDLNFHPHTGSAQKCAVKGLVTIGFGMLHPVPQPLRHIAVQARDDGEDMITLVSLAFGRMGIRVKDDADGIQVIHLFKTHTLGLHLLPDGVGGFDALFDFVMETGLLQGGLNRQHEFGHFPASSRYFAVYAGLDIAVGIRFLVFEPDILQFTLDAVKTQAMGQRDEDEHGLRENLVPLVLRHMLDGAAVVQTVCQLDENHPHVIVQGKENALEILGLETLLANVRSTGLLLRIQHVLDLGKTVHQGGDLVSEALPDVFYGIVRIFHHIVQKGGRYRLVTQADVVHHNLGHSNGMQHIRLSAAAPHIAVSRVGKVEGALDHLHFLFIGTSLLGRCLQHLPISGNNLVIFFSKFGKTHILIVFWNRRSLRSRTACLFISSSLAMVMLCLATFWKA